MIFKNINISLIIIIITGLFLSSAIAEFKLKDNPGKYLDILQDNKIVGRYMYEYDTSTSDRRVETYKPFLHVFDPEGKGPITKGAGGRYTHHRGIFIGWKAIQHNNKKYDRWHNKDGEQVHKKFTAQKAGKDRAEFTSFVHWNDSENNPIITEERTHIFLPAPEPGYSIIDFKSIITAPNGDIILDGDPEHAGIQFRAANEVDTEKTIYIFPKKDADPKKDVDYPWVGETFTLNEKQYTVIIMNHPDNPKDTKFSAYRDYARFGAFPTGTIKSGNSMTFKYRFLITDGVMPDTKLVQDTYNSYSGKNGPVPEIKVNQAEQKKSRKKNKKKKGDRKKNNKK